MHYKFIDLLNLDEIQEKILRNIPEDSRSRSDLLVFTPDVFEKCVPLVHAVETIRPWSEVHAIGLFVVMPKEPQSVHRDLGHIAETKYALNIPIYNCNIPYTSFFRVIKEPETTEVEFSTENRIYQYMQYDDDCVQEIARMHLYKPAIFNTQIPHKISNPTDDVRIVMSLRFTTALDLSKII